MRITRLLAAALLVVPFALRAQTSEPPRPRVAVHALLGAFAPTGAHRAVLDDAFAIGGQLAVGITPRLAVVSGALVAQTPSGAPGARDLTLVQYDLGAEARLARVARVTPFAGLGGGARTYRYDGGSPRARTVPAGYASLGAELMWRRAGLRVEARDYVTRDEWDGAQMRNDVTALAGLAYHFR